jgi:serine/threonine protein kinase
VTQPSLDIEGVATRICNQLNATLERVLGTGAHKYVFLINQHGVNLALKIAPVSESLKTRFERESAALLDCRHEAIATLNHVDSFQDGENEYWVTIEEFLPGGTLSDKLEHGKLSIEHTRDIGITLSSALVHLYQRNLVHRDIKPSNILFRKDNKAVLTDFGIVRVLGEPSLTHDFMAQGPGTPLYAAPEQLLNEKASIDWRTDQFGLALVLVECVLGRHAFASDGLSQREVITCVANRVPLPEQTKVELAQVGLTCLVKALAPWTVQRYRWPEEFVKVLSGET